MKMKKMHLHKLNLKNFMSSKFEKKEKITL